MHAVERASFQDVQYRTVEKWQSLSSKSKKKLDVIGPPLVMLKDCRIN